MENNIREKSIKFVTLWIALACVFIFILQNFIPNFTENFMLTQEALTKPWQFITAIFLHGSITHLFYNLFALILFGFILEKLIGSKKFFWLFLISGILANIISFPFYNASLGASGAIYAIMGCLALLRPGMTVWVFNMPMPMFLAAIIWVAGSIMGVFGLGDAGTGHIAHLSGIVLGIIYGIYLRIKNPQKKKMENRIIIHEESMRNWEDSNLR